MGLDVYLYKCPNRAEADRIEKEYEDASEALWEFEGRNGREYDQLTEGEKELVREQSNALMEKMGLVRYGTHPSRQKIEIDSTKYSDHLFKIGYFRSSYNGGGFNSVMRRLGLPDLYALFGASFDQPNETPNWDAALEQTDTAIEGFKKFLASDEAKYDVFGLNTIFAQDGVKDDEEALEVFKRHLNERKNRPDAWRSYSNRDGEFRLDGIKVFAILNGKSFGGAAHYIVYEGESKDWYLQALEVIKETIEYVLAQPDKADYYLSWSG